MFKHDHLAIMHSSRRVSRRLHRRPALHAMPSAQPPDFLQAAVGRAQHTHIHRFATHQREAAALALLAAELRIGDLERALSEARAAAHTDALTGALNRHGFAEAYQREAARAHRKHSPLALALIDLDDFKRLNDALGHQVGDEALVHLVKVLRTALRPSDILCRFGGEEFVLLLPETALSQAATAISRFQRQLAAQAIPGKDIVLTFSAGVVVQENGESLEHSILRADAATYAAKRAGKNCVVTG